MVQGVSLHLTTEKTVNCTEVLYILSLESDFAVYVLVWAMISLVLGESQTDHDITLINPVLDGTTDSE